MVVFIGSWNESQLGEVVHLLNQVSPFDRFQQGNVREAVFDDPDYAPDLLLCARAGELLVGAVVAVARRPRAAIPVAAPTGYVKLLAVAPGWQRRGIGTRLLREAERRLGQAGCEGIRIFADAPSYLRPGVDFRLTPLVCFLLERGYRREGEAVNMEVDLARADLDTAAAEERLRGLGIQLCRLEPDRAGAFERYMGQEWNWEWRTEALRSLGRNPVSTHLALQGGEIVGFASHSVTGPAQLGPMGTRPGLRGKGIGTVLLRRCLRDLHEQGQAAAEVQWVGPVCFYAKGVGATLSRCFWQFGRLLYQDSLDPARFAAGRRRGDSPGRARLPPSRSHPREGEAPAEPPGGARGGSAGASPSPRRTMPLIH